MGKKKTKKKREEAQKAKGRKGGQRNSRSPETTEARLLPCPFTARRVVSLAPSILQRKEWEERQRKREEGWKGVDRENKKGDRALRSNGRR